MSRVGLAAAGVALTLAATGASQAAPPPDPPPGAAVRLQRLNADLLSHDSATAVLQTLCDRRGPPGTRIRARQVASDEAPAATAAARRDLGVGPDTPVRHRRVELLCGEAVFSRADNWYLPDRLTPQMNAALDTTQTPFGVVVGPLGFQRHTLSAQALSGSPSEVLQHRATLATPDGRAFSLVVETYTDEVLR
ncbi:hypothetical protein [Phenylobacterium sp.]|uniref:hypothetical protein n=1 Tax=Phenylobacterium sp. TaxID=1871053 RepID=UPI0025F10E9C|nr:hypothetical protein [Phenylobacterium sp.]